MAETGRWVAADGSVSIDIDEQAVARFAPQLMELLLVDMTTKTNIIWATEEYVFLGDVYAPSHPMTVAAITGPNAGLISPRLEKSRERQGHRAKTRAEVFTPSWLCNEQNNLVDAAWFGRPAAFNSTKDRDWRSTTARIEFESTGDRTWQRYVDEPRLEAACGEAPYLVSRYDSTSGAAIALGDRIGILDRKMRVVAERSRDEAEWLEWAGRAFESVYGFEFQGDNLLLARENLLASFVDYVNRDLRRDPTESELIAIAQVVTWNVWQMDALTGTIPLRSMRSGAHGPTLFEIDDLGGPPCRIRNWRDGETIEFRSLLRRRGAL